MKCSPLTVPLVLVGVVVFSVRGIFGDPLYDCLQDSDYSELLNIVDKGLPVAKTPRHVAIIGGGMAGLTAAKFLEDAGHKVKSFTFRKLCFNVTVNIHIPYVIFETRVVHDEYVSPWTTR